MNRQEKIDFYHIEAEALQQRIDTLKARSHGFVVGEITSFSGIIFFVVLITISSAMSVKIAEGMLAAVMFGLYIFIRNRDVRNSNIITAKGHLCKAYRNEEAGLNGDFSAFDDGERYADPRHPFTFDLDIFGRDSLYQRVNRTVTTGGADRLAYYLSHVDAHKTVEEIEEYGEAVSTLQEDDNMRWRMEFIACGVDGKIDTDAIMKSLPKLRIANMPAAFGGKGIKVAAWLLAAGLLASIVAAVYGKVSPMLPVLWVFVNFFGVQGIAGKYLKAMQDLAVSLQGQMRPMMKVVRTILNQAADHSRVLERNKQTLVNAADSFEGLTNIVETLVLRGNDAYRFFSDAFGLRGVFLVCRFCQWRNMASGNLAEWTAAVAETDALVSMASLTSSHRAAVVDSGGVLFDAKGMWHPFLGDNAVRNDFTINDRNFYIITGANMAGKSTFLRAVGVNYVLALNGMPVFADSLKVSRFNLFTSMRTSDDLSHGISYFNAELLRLKQLISSLVQTGHNGRETLIILDEILKGTNSLDKLNGSRMFLRAMEDQPVTGIIATHDLELSKMENESPRFHNYCFEIKLGTDVTYSYKITPGVARNQNATFLLKQLLLKS